MGAVWKTRERCIKSPMQGHLGNGVHYPSLYAFNRPRRRLAVVSLCCGPQCNGLVKFNTICVPLCVRLTYSPKGQSYGNENNCCYSTRSLLRNLSEGPPEIAMEVRCTHNYEMAREQVNSEIYRQFA